MNIPERYAVTGSYSSAAKGDFTEHCGTPAQTYYSLSKFLGVKIIKPASKLLSTF